MGVRNVERSLIKCRSNNISRVFAVALSKIYARSGGGLNVSNWSFSVGVCYIDPYCMVDQARER